MLEQDKQTFEFNITIKQIKLAVKFPCKLTVNYQNRAIRSDVTAEQGGRYVIDRQVKVKSQNDETIQILVHLTTQKGGNIMAGIIRLSPKDLAASQGQSLSLSLQKCLDQGASCLVRIQKVWATRNTKAKSMAGQYKPKNPVAYGEYGPVSSKKLQVPAVDNYRNVQTRSQFPGYNIRKPIMPRKQVAFQPNQYNKFYGLGPKSYTPQLAMGKSRHMQRAMQLRKDKHRFDDDNKTVGKRQIDPSYRLTVQANQKNLKMDIIKYKMKSEEHQKTVEQKNKLIKRLKQQISQLHRQTVQKNFYHQQISSKNQMVQKLEDTCSHLNKENSRLQGKVIELQRGIEQVKSSMQSALHKSLDYKQQKQRQHSKQLNLRKEQIGLLNDEIKSKTNQNIRIKKIIEDLQRSLQAKTFDYEKSLQSQRAQQSKLESLLNEKIRQLEQMNKVIVAEQGQLQGEVVRKDQQIEKLEVSSKHMKVEMEEVIQLQRYYVTYKAKFADLEKAYEKIQEEKKQLQRYYLKLLEARQRDLGDFKELQSGLLTSYKKKNAELTEKVKLQASRILQLQSKIASVSSQLDKTHRGIQLSHKQLFALTQTQKSLTLLLKQKDEQSLTRQKQLSQLQYKLTNRQSLLKKDIEYKTQQLTKTSLKLTEIQHMYRQQKEMNQTLRFQATKLQGKNKLHEEIMSRLNRQIDEVKLNSEKKQSQSKQQIKEISEKIKYYEQMEKRFNKQVTELQMQDLGRNSQIYRLNKQLDVKTQKLERQIKKNQQQDHTIKQFNENHSQLQLRVSVTEQELKQILNNKKALQANFNKNQKINTIIVEEKTSVQNQLLDLRKEIQIGIGRQLELNRQVKRLREQLTRITLNSQNCTKDFQSFKQNLYNSIQTAFYSRKGKSINKGFNFAVDSNNINHKDTNYYRIHQRVNTSCQMNLNDSLSMMMITPKKLHQSQAQMALTNQQSIYQPRFNQIIQSYGRQSQQLIMQLNDNIRRHKAQIQRLQRQAASLSTRVQTAERQSSSNISSLEKQIQLLSAKNQQHNGQWQERVMISERNNRQKEQMIQDLHDELEEVSHQLSASTRSYQTQIQQLSLRGQQLKAKIYDLQTNNDFSNMTILGYEQKMFIMQSTISQLQQQLQFQRQKVSRKDKLIIQHTSKIEQIVKCLQQMKKQRNQLSRQLLMAKEKLQTEKETNQKHRDMLQQQEQKNKQMNGFNHNLIKEKQSIVKNQLRKSQKVIELEDSISRMVVQRDDLLAQVQIREKHISELKAQTKKNIASLKELEVTLQKQTHQVQKLTQSNKQKQKKTQQRELQVKNLQINLQRLMSKYDHDTKKLNQQSQEMLTKFTKQLGQKKTSILQLTNEIQKLNHIEKRLSQQNMSLQEQIFFERQTNSLSSSRFESMAREYSQLQSKLSLTIRQIDALNQQLRDKQEQLFDMANKLYGLENKLQIKQIQMRQKLQRLDFDWKNKYEQTLQDYEAKLQSYQKEKQYLGDKIDQQNQFIYKLQNEKRAIMMQDQSDKKIYEDKVKKVQSQRLSLLVDKNKQIQKLRRQIDDKEDRIRQIRHQKDIKQDDLSRVQQKSRQKDERLKSQQEKYQQDLCQLQKQLQFQKKKQSQLKKYKQFIKNNLWSSERQIKKILQSYIKNIMVLCEQQKKKDFIQIMKAVQGHIVKAMEFNLEQV